jgi:hypothetical protein
MEYIFGLPDKLKIKSDSAVELPIGETITVTRDLKDRIITDTFTVVSQDASLGGRDYDYTYYTIKNHYRFEEKKTDGIEQRITDLEIMQIESEQVISDMQLDIAELQKKEG